MNKKDLLDRCARSGEERVLLARVMDKLELAQNRGVPAHTPFLSPGERAAVEDLLRLCGPTRSLFWGGYPDAERAACVFLPDWQEAEDWQGDGESCPVRALRCTWSGGQKLTHRDFLGSILGLGLDREKVGDLLVADGRCDVLALEEVADFLVFHMEQAGRVKLKCSPLPLDRLEPRERHIISLRFGLDGAREQTQKEVADRLGISQSYISRLEKRIIARLKKEIVRMM